MTGELSEKAIKKALESFSWSQLAAQVDGIERSEGAIDKVLGIVERSEALIIKRDEPDKEVKRDELMASLASFLEGKGLAAAAERVRAHGLKLIEIAAGYRSILNLRAESEGVQMSPELRVSAALENSNQAFAEMLTHGERAFSDRVDLGKANIEAPGGQTYSPDAVHGWLVNTLSGTIAMEAHVNQWFEEDGAIVIPALPEPKEDERRAAGRIQHLAGTWNTWQRMEQRHRYLGGQLTRRVASDQERHDHGIEHVWESRLDSDGIEICDYVANDRLKVRMSQEFFGLEFDLGLKHSGSGITGTVALLPAQAVSTWEVKGMASLIRILSIHEDDANEEYAGLRITEWVRGYAVLRQRSEEAIRTGADGMTIRYSRDDLVALLQRMGLEGDKAAIFIGHATFKRKGRDLFDQPLLRLSDGSLALVALCAATNAIPQVVLSALSMLKVDLGDRGDRFQQFMIDFLRSEGFEPKNINCHRDGETFDYDVAFVWGDYLFHLECKSRALSGGSIVAARNFWSEITKTVGQVRRQREGLAIYPDILATEFPEAVGKQVVHCVVNSLPYALPHAIDGIFFVDEGVITRFFKGSAIGEITLDRDHGVGEIDPETAVAYLWDGDEPTPEDFIRQLGNPIQVAFAIHHTKADIAEVQIGPDSACLVATLGRKDVDRFSMREAARKAGYRQARMQTEAEQAERDRTREIANPEMDRLAAERRRRKPT